MWCRMGILLTSVSMFDGFVKNPFSALRCILRHCGVAISTPLSSGFACLETGAFYEAVLFVTYLFFKQAAGYLVFGCAVAFVA
jgi:hypothetical protein